MKCRLCLCGEYRKGIISFKIWMREGCIYTPRSTFHFDKNEENTFLIYFFRSSTSRENAKEFILRNFHKIILLIDFDFDEERIYLIKKIDVTYLKFYDNNFEESFGKWLEYVSKVKI